ncbi:MAG: D-inositol-3-phosphate glycosyltransferase [bacterium]|nr:D-inositol-3-phosphate glycosyltransferase [bacterium]
MTIALDLREVARSTRGYRRMLNLVIELDRLDSSETLALILDSNSDLKGVDLSPRDRFVSAARALRMLRRPLVGAARRLLLGDIRVMHFLTGDVWASPSCPTVVTLHDLAPLDLPELFFDTAREEAVYRRRLGTVFRVADRIVTVSDTSQARLELLGLSPKAPLRRVYQGIDPAFHPEDWTVEARKHFRRNIGCDMGFLFYCGGIDGRKNLSLLLDAYRVFREKTSTPRKLVLAGDPNVSPRGMKPLGELIAERGLERDVILLGWVSDPFLRRVYSSAALFLYPSRMEGFGYSPLEAMACGCPVVCSNAAALPETVGNAAKLLPPTDPETWASAALELIEDREERGRLVERGLTRAQAFSWKRTAEELFGIYRELL